METKTLEFVPAVFPVQGIARVERIRAELRNAANSFINVGADLKAAYERQEWQELGLRNFAEYLSQFNQSVSWGYDLIRIAELAEQYPQVLPQILDAGISNMRLLLPRIPEQASTEQIETMVEMGAEHTWKDLRQALASGSSDAPLDPAYDWCPACGVKLELSRAATLHVAK